MWTIEERAVRCGEYIVRTGGTVRACAKALGTSKSTVHKDIVERLVFIDPILAKQARAVLEVNLSERHLRGGESTKRKYAKRGKLHPAPRDGETVRPS